MDLIRASQAPTGNEFLDTLPRQAFELLAQRLTHETLPQGQILASPGHTISRVYFPVRSMISTVSYMLSGATIEVGIAGHDGFGPHPVAFGSTDGRGGAVVQIAGTAYAMPVDEFLAHRDADAALHERCARFAEYSFAAATQFAACNGLHPIEERYARWMLMADDRTGPGDIFLTQEYMAEMLGVRRASVTIVALALSKAGWISYQRGRIRILDRTGLESAACECYAAVNSDLQRLMGYTARRQEIVAA